MRAALPLLGKHLGVAKFVARYGFWPPALVLLPQFAALAIMFATESTLVGMAAFLLAWGILNFLWLALLRRPAAAGVLSLTLLTVLVLLSDLKHHVLKMTASFIDLMIIDTDTVTFLFTIFPALRWIALLSAAVLVPIVLLCWRHDPLRVRRLAAIALAGACVVGLASLETSYPVREFDAFYGNNEVSSFARTGVDAISELLTHGFLESDAVSVDRLRSAADTPCRPAAKPPHIILIHDEFELRHPYRARN